MTLTRRAMALLALSVAMGSLAACGGGGGSSGSTATSAVLDLSAGGNNVMTVTVDGTTGTTDSSGNSQGNINTPYVEVTVCVPGTTQCVTVNHVLVDTGSYGLRLFASTLSSLPLSAEADPNNPNTNVLAECAMFADGYTWGSVALADVQLNKETAGNVPIQVIDDDGSVAGIPSTAPTSCSEAGGTNVSTPGAFYANGVLGIGVFKQDCGTSCETSTYHFYYTCVTGSSSSSPCTDTTVADADQVTNPVSLLATDNNGVILQFPSVTASGASSATGYLAFGIGTESDNSLDDAKPLTTDANGYIITTFNGKTLSDSFIDSGSNTFAFDSSIANCTDTTDYGSGITSFYCPSSTQTLSATNQGQNGTVKNADFSVANAESLFSSNSWEALDNVGATLGNITLSGTGGAFDWGLPFFYGRTVYFALENEQAGGTTGPYYAY